MKLLLPILFFQNQPKFGKRSPLIPGGGNAGKEYGFWNERGFVKGRGRRSVAKLINGDVIWGRYKVGLN